MVPELTWVINPAVGCHYFPPGPQSPSQPLKSSCQFCCLVNRGTLGVNSLPKTVTRRRRGCDLNPGPSAPESSTLTTRLRSGAVSEHCIPVSRADKRRHLSSANRHLLAVPRFRLNTYGRREFSVAGVMAWNSLPDFIRDPTSSTDCFRRLLKTYLFARY